MTKEKTNLEFLKHLSKFILSSGINSEFISLRFHRIIWELEKPIGSKEDYDKTVFDLEKADYIEIRDTKPYGHYFTAVGFTRKGLDYLSSSSENL